jgi:hypothetical protein
MKHVKMVLFLLCRYKKFQIVDAGKTENHIYRNKTEVMANGQWGINQTGSNAINGSTKDLETIYNC